ncbi:MAG: TolC family protein [Muribaculaceae bacterium]|jgi:outer membrane protein TolC|nr:TolC family protein [Muribaculaceae bacterium]
MKRLFFVISIFIAVNAMAQTLEQCQQAAERNYPLIAQHDLIARTTDLTVANIQKGWLPQLSATAQATYQSAVTAWPDEMKGLMQQMGVDMKGLAKDQYRVGLDLQQTVFDGGAIGAQKQVAREQGAVQQAQLDVSLYQVRQRVNEMYFGLLLLDDQISLNNDLQEQLAASEKKLTSMVKHGTAAQCDLNNVTAERLNVVQQMTTLESQRRVLMAMLGTFCGLEMAQVSKPAAVEAVDGNNRPELRLIDSQLRLADAQDRALTAALLPRLGVFAQGFYGYPGYNMFKDMMGRQWSWNGMVGARLTWNIGALYTHRNDKAKVQLQRETAQNQREVFLFNNRLEQMQQNEAIDRYRRLMSQDDEIIALREQVRKAAESKLSHGIIDVNDLLRDINSENAARLQRSIHEIEMLKQMYDLKYTTNN